MSIITIKQAIANIDLKNIDDNILDTYYMMSLETCLYYFLVQDIPMFKRWIYICDKNEDFPMSIESYRPSDTSLILLSYITLNSTSDNVWSIYRNKDNILYLKDNNDNIIADTLINGDNDMKITNGIDMMKYDSTYQMEQWPLPNNKGQLMKWLRGMHILEDNNIGDISGIVDMALRDDTYPIGTIIDMWSYNDLPIILISLMKIRMIEWIDKMIKTYKK